MPAPSRQDTDEACHTEKRVQKTDGQTTSQTYNVRIFEPNISDISGESDRLPEHSNADDPTTHATAPRDTKTEQLNEEIRYWKDRFQESRRMCTQHVRRADRLSNDLEEYRDKDLETRKAMRDFERLLAEFRNERQTLQTALMGAKERSAKDEKTISDLRNQLEAERAVVECQTSMSTSMYGHLLRQSAAEMRSNFEKCTGACASR